MKKTFKSATVGCSNIKKDVVESPDFLAGKNGDVEATDRVIEQIWHPHKTKVLEKQLTSETVFLSQPSTTKSNVIPIQLALRLSSKLDRPFVNGDEYFDTLHNIASKNISRDRRVFNKREFNFVDKEKMNSLLEGKDIIIIDDIITTGSSIRYFKEFLTEQNLNVIHAVGLMGDRRLELDSSTKNKLSDLLKNKNINVDIEDIDHITRMEAGGLIRLLNSLKGQNGIKKFTKDLQGVQRARVTSNIKGFANDRGDTGTTREDISNEPSSPRIQANISPPNQAGNSEFVRADSLNRNRAMIFATKTPKEAVKEYPELAGAVAAVAAMEKKAETDGLTHEQRAIVSARVRQNIIKSIERGNIPQMKIRVEQVKEILNESTPEREM